MLQNFLVVSLWTDRCTGVAFLIGALVTLGALERLVAALRGHRGTQKHHGAMLPLCPRDLPIIGNVLQVPTDCPKWLTFVAWAEKYKFSSDVMHFSTFGTPFIVLSSRRAIHELLENRSALYSDRPRSVMGGELVGWNVFLPLNPYNERFKRLRRLLPSAMGTRRADELQPIQAEKVRKFVLLLLEYPAAFRSHIFWLSASTAMQLTVGINAATIDHPSMQFTIQANDEFLASAAPGAFVVDIFPILKHIPDWFPGAGFKAQAKEWRKTMVRIRDEPYERAKAEVTKGIASPSFISGLLHNNPHPSPDDEDIYKHVLVTSLAGGIDTTAAAMEWFILAMLLNPEVQHKAQAELDSVVGTGRLPTFEDRPKLPYVEAVVKEVHRWNPVAPMGLPHKLMQDDVYEGFLLPAGSTVLPNIWAICHDPECYPEPNAFKPERYLSADEDENSNPDPRGYIFGFGKRICPGQYLADNMLFITVATTLAVLKFENVLDEHGRPAEPTVTYQGELVNSPGTFQCRIRPRSKEVEQLVISSVAEG